MTSQLLSEGSARPKGRGLRLPHLLRFPLPQLQHLLYLSHLHPHLFFQLLSLQDYQILFLHHRCCTPCSRASTGGSPLSCRAFRAWACHPSWAWRSLMHRWPSQEPILLLLEGVGPPQPRSLLLRSQQQQQRGRMSSPLLSTFILTQMHTWLKRRVPPQIKYLSHPLHLLLRRPSHLHQWRSQSSLSRIHQQLQHWILMKISHMMSRTFKFVHVEHFSLFSVILWFMFSYFNFSFYVSVILNFSTLTCLLVPKACLNSELIENDMQWIALYEMSVWEWFEWAIVWFEWIGMVRELFWSSL